MKPARLIIDKQRGPMNMAVDEALLLSAPRCGPTLRFYQWEEPTLSLGYFQSAAERSQHEASTSCPIVRRSTGGGAILHHHELTYSFVMPANQRQDKSSSQPLYYAFHETLVEALAERSFEATLFLEEPLQQVGGLEPFLCFQRRATGDVLHANAKICGSAQRRQKEALLQHGSVLLRRSTFAPELAGLEDLTKAVLTAEELAKIWLPRLEKRLELSFQAADLQPLEWSTAERLAEDRFGADSWSSRR